MLEYIAYCFTIDLFVKFSYIWIIVQYFFVDFCFLFYLVPKHLLLSALCTYMLAIVESYSNTNAETLKKWQGTEISIEEVGGNTFSCVFPL